jgi:hypothetical protein
LSFSINSFGLFMSFLPSSQVCGLSKSRHTA